MTVSLIVAWSKGRVIGLENSIPWKMKADMNRFRRLTLGKPVIAGRKTFESIGKPLKGRTNIILTRNPEYRANGCLVVHSANEALRAAKKSGAEEAMVIGGSSVFELFLPLADRIYLTLIHADLEGDARFPELDMREWEIVEDSEFQADKDNPYPYAFLVLERKSKD